MRSGNVRPCTRTAVTQKVRSFCVLLGLLLGFASDFALPAQTAFWSESQADINQEAQAAYQAGTAAAANNDLKTAEAQFETVVRLVPQIEEGHSALGTVLPRLGIN